MDVGRSGFHGWKRAASDQGTRGNLIQDYYLSLGTFSLVAG